MARKRHDPKWCDCYSGRECDKTVALEKSTARERRLLRLLKRARECVAACPDGPHERLVEAIDREVKRG